ncbi:MAG TPA: translocation/assembly module TamB domain-containing protein [Bacteroidales bacterium]|nr:translocation/assembly module TamB domain-containing protein [Bacteroidales bacterium]
MKNFKGRVKISEGKISIDDLFLITNNSKINGSISFYGNDFNSFNHFVDSVYIDSKLDNSIVSFKDIAFFAPELLGMNANINLSGDIKGEIAHLKLKNLFLKYGNFTEFKGDITMIGLPDIHETFIKAIIKDFKTHTSDIKSIQLPSDNNTEPVLIHLPQEINNLENINVKGVFIGFINNFVSKAVFTTNLGLLKTDITLKKLDNKKEKFLYYGDLQANNFNIGNIIGSNSKLGSISCKLNISGIGINIDNIKANISGIVDSLYFMDYCYKNIDIKGDFMEKKFKGNLLIYDPYIKLNFSGLIDFSDIDTLPLFDFKAKLQNVYLSKLNLFKRDSMPILSANMVMKFKGNNIDNIFGNILVDSLYYSEGKKKYFINKINLLVDNDDKNNKKLELNSDFVYASVCGSFKFSYLPASLDNFLDDYLPSFVLYKKSYSDVNLPEENFVYEINLKEINPLFELFFPKLKILSNALFKGNYSSINNFFEINGVLPQLEYIDYIFKNINFNVKTENHIINTNINCSKLYVNKNIIFENADVKSDIKNDSILFTIGWDNLKDSSKNSGQLVGYMFFKTKSMLELSLAPSFFVINDSIWNVNEKNEIFIDTNSIKIVNLILQSKNQKIIINGTISENIKDKLLITFKDFNISNIDPFLIKQNVDIDGIINGMVEIVDLYKSINFYSDVKINDFAFNKDRLGTVVLKSSWDNIKQGLLVKADVIYKGNIGENIPLSVNGYYYPTDKKNNFDLNIDVENLKLTSIEKYLAGIISNLRGKASGKLKLTGKTENPQLLGYINLFHVGFHLDYLGTNYSLMGKIFISPNTFSFDSIIVYDNNNNQYRGNTAECSGKIFHNAFNDFKFDITIKPYKFTLLNTNSTQNELFYGQVIASGVVNIKGTTDNIFIDVSAKTEKDTRFVLPFNSTGEITESNFIYFITKDSINNKSETITEQMANNTGNIQLKFNLDVTPEAEIKIEFDPKIGDVITTRGKGNFLINASTNGDFSMFGQYTITEGDYLFTFENVINKHFKIANGGTISWNGDPYLADVSIQAIYDKPRAPLYDLVMHVDSSSKYRQKIPVYCILGLSGSLFNPNISFDIELPGADEKTKELFYTVLDTANDQEMIRQVFSLMVLNRFLPKQNTYDNPLGVGVGNTSFEMLSSQLSNWLSQISNKFDIGFNYRPGDALNSNQVEVALKTQFFQDRLIIDGNLGMANETYSSHSQASNIVGDVNVEYKLTEDGRVRIKAYNKANTAELLENNAPYTQGIGIFYRKEFNSFYDILKKRK